MSDDVQGNERPGWAPVVASLGLLLASYPLSLGPMCWLCEAGYLAPDNQFWTAFYTPLGWLTESVPLCEKWLFAYLGLWGM